MNILASLILLALGGALMAVGGFAVERGKVMEAKILLAFGAALLVISAMVR